MKRVLVFLGALIVGFAAMAQETVTNIGVIPTPQKIVMGQGVCDVSSREILSFKDYEVTEKQIAKLIKKGNVVIIEKDVETIEGSPSLKEAYKLVIEPNQIIIYHATLNGLVNAYRTISQVNMSHHGKLPCMTVVDWPAFEYRGWLDDISRGPIVNPIFSWEQGPRLEHFKMNFGSYYTEHALYNSDYPDIVPPVFQSNIDCVMANLQCFAHFEKTLRIPFYQGMKDTKNNVNPAEEETYDFLREQIRNTWRQYHNSQFFNINCDETESLGSGRAREYVLAHGASEVYCQHINKVYDIVMEEHQKLMSENEVDSLKPEVLMWGDIVGKDPEMLKKLPKEMNYVVWTYVGQEDYNSMLEPFKKMHDEQGTPFWVAPGVSHWSSTPQVRNYMQNIANLARDGYLAGARGLINTAWDDSGESLFGDCWHAMLWACEMAWNPIKNTDPAKAKEELAVREKIFNENFNKLYPGVILEEQISEESPKDYAQMIYAVGDLNHNEWVGDWFNTGTLMQPLENFYPSNVDDGMLKRCDEVDRIVGQVANQVDSASLPHFAYACHRILCVSEKSRLRVLLYKALQSGADQDIASAKSLSEQYFRHIHSLKKEYLNIWDEESGPYFRDEICARYDRLGQEVLEAFNHVFITTKSGDDGKTPMVEMKTIEKNLPIYYTIDGRDPSKGSLLYRGPFALERSCLVKAVTFYKWDDRIDSEQYLLCHKGMGHLKKLRTAYSDYKEVYSGGGDNALADGQLGSDVTYADGHWQGYWGKDIDAEYDFGEVTAVNNISMRFHQNVFDWILAPETIEVYTSKDGKEWTLVRSEKYFPDFHLSGSIVHTDAIRDLGLKTRYLRVEVKNPGKLPKWHPAPGWDSYLFIDEIVIE